jgi:trans-aconitate methyltransferase
MRKLPSPKIYEQEIKYMPWGILIKEILGWIVKNAPQKSNVLDLMCGPGQLLSKIRTDRKDLSLTGVDDDQRYIDFAKNKYPTINFICADVLNWQTDERYDLILVTGGLHHIPYDQQTTLLNKVAELLNENGTCILADPYIDNYSSEKERKIAAAKLGHEYIKAVIENNASDEIISASIDILSNDILPRGEYKNSKEKTKKLISPFFSKVGDDEIPLGHS